jgi:hypothetical protein
MADDRDPASAAPPETSWADYYQHTLGRELRPPFVRGIRVLQEAGVRPAQAIEVGFGDGEETLALLAAGWRVLAIDQAGRVGLTPQNNPVSQVALAGGRGDLRTCARETAFRS